MDIESMYQENIMDHYSHPRNFGKLDNPSIHHHEKNPLCGDALDIYIKFDEKNNVNEVKFNGKGCAISMSSASMLTEKVKGKNIKDLEKLTKKDILELLGIPISPVRLKCALLSLDTIKNAASIYDKYIHKKDHKNNKH